MWNNKAIAGILLLSLLAATGFSQKKRRGEFKWEKVAKHAAEIPEQFMDEDVVDVREVFRIEPYSVFSRYRLERTTKVLTQRGLESATIVSIPVTTGEWVTLVKVRTIKPDRTVIEMSDDDIKREFQAIDQDLYGTIKFAVPGVEVGDEVQVVIEYVMGGYNQQTEYFFHGYYPALEKRIEIITNRMFRIQTKVYNSSEFTPTQHVTDTANHMVWDLKNLAGVKHEANSIPHLELPFMRFITYMANPYLSEEEQRVQYTQKSRWGSVNEEFSYEKAERKSENLGRMKYLVKKYDTITAGIPEEDRIKKLQAIHDYINENVDYVNLDDKESNHPVGYFMYNKRVNRLQLMRLYDHVFKHLEIDHWVGLGRSKLMGPLDVWFISVDQFTSFFYAFDHDGKRMYLFPADGQFTYELDAVNPTLENTMAILVKVKGGRIETPNLPFNSPQDNRQNGDFNATVDLENLSMGIDGRKVFSGYYATYTRKGFFDAEQEGMLEKAFFSDEVAGIHVDTIYIQKYERKHPFPLTIRLKYKDSRSVTKVEDSLYSINIESWRMGMPKLDTAGRKLDYYPTFMESQKNRAYLGFDRDVELMNGEELSASRKFGFGEYLSKVHMLGPRRIAIETFYRINKIPIESGHVKQLAELYAAMSENASTPVLIKIK